MSLELIPLCTLSAAVPELIQVSPEFVIGEVTAARCEGERLKASMKGRASADWLTVSPRGYGTLDVRLTLETDDGALIFASYKGRLLFDTMTVYATPLFETGDERYAWLNLIQAVSKGQFVEPGMLVYEVFELR
jgi:hypothetical protein